MKAVFVFGKGKDKESDPTDASANASVDCQPTLWPPFIFITDKMCRCYVPISCRLNLFLSPPPLVLIYFCPHLLSS